MSDRVRASLLFGIEVSSKQRAEQIRDACAEWLNKQDGITVHTQNFTSDPVRDEGKEVKADKPSK